MLMNLKLFNYFKKKLDKNYKIECEIHTHGGNDFAIYVLYYLVFNNSVSHDKIIFIKFRKENDAIELKQFIENYSKE
jgi:hypothetical protein